MEANPSKDPNPRKALGRGLASLMPQTGVSISGGGASVALRQLPIERVRPNRGQPRKQFDEAALSELAASIESQGVLQPIVVRRAGDGYEIVAGERRWRAAARAGLHEIPAIVKDLADVDALQVALIENLQREDLDPLEEAQAFKRLISEHGLTHEKVAEAVGKSRAAITNSLRLLKLPDAVLTLLAEGRLTAGHARALMTLDDDAMVERLAADVVQRGMSVRDTESRARQMQQAAEAPAGDATPRPAAESDLEQRLQHALGTKVRLRHRKGRGRIEIHFHSLSELDRLLDCLATHS